MLKRIYIDNFNCLVNFELNFDSINLLLGDNGSGKSSVFDVLWRLQFFILGLYKVEEIFPSAKCTRWQNLPIQNFELEIYGNHGKYKYELAIQHSPEYSCVQHERLMFNNQRLLNFEQGEVQIFNDDYIAGAKYPFNSSQSILPFLASRQDNTKLTWFNKRIQRFIIVRIVPSLIYPMSEKEQILLNPSMDNYVSWYRYISQDQGKVAKLIQIIKEVLPGFVSFRFQQYGDKYTILKVRFVDDSGQKNIIEYEFNELSDGQRILITLYTLLYCTESEDYTLCIDEPENFLAIPEIQPWLIQLYDFCDERKLQALLISHHPELINYLLASPIGYWFERQSNAPARVRKISNEETDDAGLKISELIARGWLHES